MHEDIYVDRSV